MTYNDTTLNDTMFLALEAQATSPICPSRALSGGPKQIRKREVQQRSRVYLDEYLLAVYLVERGVSSRRLHSLNALSFSVISSPKLPVTLPPPSLIDFIIGFIPPHLPSLPPPPLSRRTQRDGIEKGGMLQRGDLATGVGCGSEEEQGMRGAEQDIYMVRGALLLGITLGIQFLIWIKS